MRGWFHRQPVGWLQLVRRPGRFAGALAGVAFATLLVFTQLGFQGALTSTVQLPYRALAADILLRAPDANTLQDGSPLPRQRMLDALAMPGVAAAVPIHVGRLDWRDPVAGARSLDVLGVDPRVVSFRLPELAAANDLLALPGAALIDRGTRNLPAGLLAALATGEALRFEAMGRTITLRGSFWIGGGFSSDGHLVVSDQSFLNLFRQRSPGAPNLILLRVEPGADIPRVVEALRAALPAGDTAVHSVAEAIALETRFQTTQRPVGIIFGLGVLMGALVGAIIVHQVLATDVSDHLREYATFRAMGHPQGLLTSIVFEQALILGVLGFIPGALVATGLYAALSAMTGLPVAMPPLRLLVVLLGTVGVCVLSGLLATRRLARVEPAELFA